jgi:hypothetical protein
MITPAAQIIFGAPSCPSCKNSLTSFKFSRTITNERFGITTRTYYGWCLDCNIGCEVEQFLSDGRWLIHRWRRYSNYKKPKAGHWHIVSELPVPAVVIGVGREFDTELCSARQ